MHLQRYRVLWVQYIYMPAQEEDDAGTAGVLMEGGNKYSSGPFQLLPGFFLFENPLQLKNNLNYCIV